jgi:hypothetical protein
MQAFRDIDISFYMGTRCRCAGCDAPHVLHGTVYAVRCKASGRMASSLQRAPAAVVSRLHRDPM